MGGTRTKESGYGYDVAVQKPATSVLGDPTRFEQWFDRWKPRSFKSIRLCFVAVQSVLWYLHSESFTPFLIAQSKESKDWLFLYIRYALFCAANKPAYVAPEICAGNAFDILAARKAKLRCHLRRYRWLICELIALLRHRRCCFTSSYTILATHGVQNPQTDILLR